MPRFSPIQDVPIFLLYHESWAQPELRKESTLVRQERLDSSFFKFFLVARDFKLEDVVSMAVQSQYASTGILPDATTTRSSSID